MLLLNIFEKHEKSSEVKVTSSTLIESSSFHHHRHHYYKWFRWPGRELRKWSFCWTQKLIQSVMSHNEISFYKLSSLWTSWYLKPSYAACTFPNVKSWTYTKILIIHQVHHVTLAHVSFLDGTTPQNVYANGVRRTKHVTTEMSHKTICNTGRHHSRHR
jgi:hypothetical protein